MISISPEGKIIGFSPHDLTPGPNEQSQGHEQAHAAVMMLADKDESIENRLAALDYLDNVNVMTQLKQDEVLKLRQSKEDHDIINYYLAAITVNKNFNQTIKFVARLGKMELNKILRPEQKALLKNAVTNLTNYMDDLTRGQSRDADTEKDLLTSLLHQLNLP